jgi:hypothetical protein
MQGTNSFALPLSVVKDFEECECLKLSPVLQKYH